MTEAATILVVDDDEDVLMAARLLLRQHFERVLTSNDPEQIEGIAEAERVDVFLLDMNFAIGSNTGAEGLHWLGRVRALDPNAVVVLMTAEPLVGETVTASREMLSPSGSESLAMTSMLTGRSSHARQAKRHRIAAKQENSQ